MSLEEAVKEALVQVGWTTNNIYIGILILAITQFLFGLWLKARLEQSMKHEFDKKLEEFRFDMKKREQAARIAELMSTIHYTSDKCKKLNQIVWELSLWLPTDTLKAITEYCIADDKKQDPKAVLIKAREIIQGKKDELKPDDIVHFIEDE